MSSEGYTRVPNFKAALASAKLTRGLAHLDRGHNVNVEAGSIYGAAILMPQLARTAGWTKELTSRAIASWMMLFICIGLHAYLLKYIAKEEKVMDGFGGQMYLCDFGAHIDGCQGDECIGPGGTHMTPARLYSWNAWITRSFVRDSLKGLFPTKQDQIDVIADPGEYGLESYTCRILCVIIFVISVMPEMMLCRDMLRLLINIPSQNEDWLELVGDGSEEDDAETSLTRVKVKTAGMSYGWKAINFLLVLLPKLILLYMTANAGVTFLMETAGMDDIIVNSVAMGFLLSLDELIVDALLAKSTDRLTEECEAYDFQQKEESQKLTSEESVKKFSVMQRTDSVAGFCSLLWQLMFNRLMKTFICALFTTFFVAKYYFEHCEYRGGQWVSKPVSAPKSLDFGFANMLSIFQVPEEDTPYWAMPED